LEDIDIFSLFPEILNSVDTTTFSTKKDKLPLLIGAGKDSNKRNFSAFRCFLPSEQRWVFKFDFGHNMIPSLLGQKHIIKFQQVNTDGDTDSNLFSFGQCEDSSQ
jgi:hypothetical protein